MVKTHFIVENNHKMPNHITNYLSVSGTSENVELFKKENSKTNDNDDNENVEERTLSFHFVVPEPDWSTQTTSTGFTMFSDNGWYGWRVKNWGTKWDAYDTEDIFIEKPDTESDKSESLVIYHYTFKTAWAPPYPWLIEAAKKYPELSFELKWYDEDYPECGMITAKNDSVVKTKLDTMGEKFRFIAKHFPDVHEDECNTEWREQEYPDWNKNANNDDANNDDSDEDEETNGMKEVYEECHKLANEYEKKEESSYPSYCWCHVDGERYLRAQFYEELSKKRKDYYEKCVSERSYRKPTRDFKKKSKINE